MSTQNLSDVVRGIINDWVSQDKLFTALDVSLAVKQTMPHARHREVREIVRAEYANMQNSSYGRTDINVTLEDGSNAVAVLYHPLADSWDLDAKYDSQKRSQTLKSPVDNKSGVPAPAPIPTAVVIPPGVAPTSVFGWCGTPPPGSSPKPNPPQSVVDLLNKGLPQTPAATPAPAVNPNKHLWDALFDSAPSLFPRR